jgi:hypothetical protein
MLQPVSQALTDPVDLHVKFPTDWPSLHLVLSGALAQASVAVVQTDVYQIAAALPTKTLLTNVNVTIETNANFIIACGIDIALLQVKVLKRFGNYHSAGSRDPSTITQFHLARGPSRRACMATRGALLFNHLRENRALQFQ